MARNHDDQNSIRRYLLNQLSDAGQQQIEQRLLTDNELFDQLEAVEDELIDQYLAGALSKDDSEMFEQHFPVTPERHQKLRFAKAFLRYVATHPSEQSTRTSNQPQKTSEQPGSSWSWLNFLSATPLRAVAFAALILVAGLGVWRIFFYQSDVDKALLALNSAYRQQRPVEARITQLNYAPFVTTRGQDRNNVNEAERERAKLMLVNARNDEPTPAVHHALGKVYLAENDFDRAIEQLEEALKADPNNAEIHADLGAAWLEKGKLEIERQRSDKTTVEPSRGLEYLGRSLASLNRALELNPNLTEALFNRALCYESMFLPRQAADGWRQYLSKDPTSQWAQEAQRHLSLLRERNSKSSDTQETLVARFFKAYELGDSDTAWLLISRQRDISGGPIGNTLVDEYLKNSTKGQADESLKKLAALSFVGTLERERAGDLYVAELVEFLRSSSTSQHISLIEARQFMKLGRESLFADKPETAASYYGQAKEILERIRDVPDSIYVEYPLGHSYLLQSKSKLSLATFDRVVNKSEVRHYKWLQAQALNATANVEIGLTNLSLALDVSNRSLNLSKAIGDTTGEIKTTNQLAQQYFRLGNYPKSLDLHQQSLVLATVAAPELIQLWRNYFAVAMPLSAMGLHAAAIEYEKEALRHAEELKMPQTVCRSFAILGLMFAGQGDYEEAVKNIAMAVESARKIPSETARKESIAYSSLQLGLIHRQSGDASKAIADYDQSIQLYGELEDFQPFSYVAHKGKLLSCIKLKGCSSIDEEIKISLDLFEKFRRKILEQSNRDSFFDTEQSIYDVAIEYEFSRSNFQTAFDYSERARGRSLLDLANDRAKLIGDDTEPDLRFDVSNEPGNFQQIKAALPREAQILQYAMLEHKLLIFLICDSDFVHVEKVISLSDLDERLRRYLKLISSPSANNLEALARDGMALYEILIKPVEKSLKKDKLLCIVPDKTLSYLPFAALMSTESGRYLVNEYEVIYAPSSTMFIRSSELASENKGASEILLGVGNPSFSHAQFPLSNLPSAAKEVGLIKGYYAPSSRTLIGSRATKGMVLAEMERSDVVHLAVHSIVDETSPMRSKLLLAHGTESDGEADGELYAYEIYGLQFPNTRLVVLSACETGAGRYYRGEGIMGLSRSFIAANVPLVIASLWRVDSDSTAELMIAFHKNRKTENLSSTKALQKAQQNMSKGADQRYQHPYYWAAFTPVGGYAEF